MDNTNSNNYKRQSASDALSQMKEKRQKVSQYAQTSKPTIKTSNNNSNSGGDDGCGMEIFIYIVIVLVVFAIFSFF